MKFALQLLKQLFFVICEVIWTVIKTVSVPIYTTTVKMLLIAACLWCVCKYIPHGLPYLADVSFIGWVTVIAIYRLVTVKYDDFNDDGPLPEEVPSTPNYLKDEDQTELEEEIEVPQPPPNVGVKIDVTTTSTRE